MTNFLFTVKNRNDLGIVVVEDVVTDAARSTEFMLAGLVFEYSHVLYVSACASFCLRVYAIGTGF